MFDPADHTITFTTAGHLASSPGAVRELFASLAASDASSLTLYFLAGTADEAAGLAHARDLYAELSENGSTVPLFIIWQTDVLDAIQDTLMEASYDTPLFAMLLRKLLKFVARRALAATNRLADGHDPLLQTLASERLATVDPTLLSLLEGPVGQQNADELALDSHQLQAELADVAAQGLGQSNWSFLDHLYPAIFNRYATGTAHGLLGTVLEELYRTLYAGRLDASLWATLHASVQQAYASSGAGGPTTDIPGGQFLLRQLETVVTENPQLSLNVIGHGIGCIHVCHFIDHAAQLIPAFNLEHVILLTPACSFALFQRTVLPHNCCVGHFRIFTMSDIRERQDALLKLAPLAYPHSLLYLVSGLLEPDGPDTPLLGLARHLSGAAPTAVSLGSDIETFLHLFTKPIVYAPTSDAAAMGLRAAFSSHAGPSGPHCDRATLDSIASLLRPPALTGLTELTATPPKTDEIQFELASELYVPESDSAVPMPPGAMIILPDQFGDDWLLPTVSGVSEQIIATNEIVDHAVISELVRAGRAVARIVAPGVEDLDTIAPDEREHAWREAVADNRTITGYGTGWILGETRRVLITNNHVLPLPEMARDAQVEFGFERHLRGGTEPKNRMRLRPDRLFLTSPNMRFNGLDYTAVALSHQPPEEFGYLEPTQGKTADSAQHIFIVQHPNGKGKAYVFNHNRKVSISDTYVTYVSDTLEGSSGSPCFDERIHLVALHHLGGYEAQVGTRMVMTNLGSRIELIIQDIARQLRSLPDCDESRVRHWFGDGQVLTAWCRLPAP